MTRSAEARGRAVLLLFFLGLATDTGAQPAGVPTFTRDVAPILYEHCVACHRPGQIAPMSLITYGETRPWARAIKLKVETREMPPWNAQPGIQAYKNDPSLPQAAVDTISAWVDGGALEGNAADLPEAPTFPEGWSIGEPDYVFTMIEPYVVPAGGTVPYLYFDVPTGLTEDIFISASEVRPGDTRVVHHVTTAVVPGDDVPVNGTPKLERTRTPVEGARLSQYVPNNSRWGFGEGMIARLPAGALIEAEMHYTTVGTTVADQTSWGVVLAQGPVSEPRLSKGGIVSAGEQFVIPPHDPNFELVGRRIFLQNAFLLDMAPHMHSRGKDMTYTVVRPGGERIVALSVPRYDFNWQHIYELAQPIFMPKGSLLEVVMHFDNSAGNRDNPDPNAEVRFGDQTWEEMAFGFYSYAEGASP